MREALLLHEEAMRVNRMCRELRKKDVLQDVLRLAHDRSLNKYASIDEEDDFQVSFQGYFKEKVHNSHIAKTRATLRTLDEPVREPICDFYHGGVPTRH